MFKYLNKKLKSIKKTIIFYITYYDNQPSLLEKANFKINQEKPDFANHEGDDYER